MKKIMRRMILGTMLVCSLGLVACSEETAETAETVEAVTLETVFADELDTMKQEAAVTMGEGVEIEIEGNTMIYTYVVPDVTED